MVYQYPFEGVEEQGKRAVWNKGRKIVKMAKSMIPKFGVGIFVEA